MKTITILLILSLAFAESDAQILKNLGNKINKAIKNKGREINEKLDNKQDSIITTSVDNPNEIARVINNKSGRRGLALLSNEELVYGTDFDFPDNFWSNDRTYSSGGAVTTLVKNGTYTVSNKSKHFITSIIDLKVDHERDFSIETSVAFLDGDDDGSFGITFGQNGRKGENIFPFNALLINLNGSFSLFTQKGHEEFDNLVNYTKSNTIKKRERAYNQLKLERKNGEFSIYINKEKVSDAGLTQPEFFGNYIGFYVNGSQELSFDYFVVKYLDAKPKLKQAVQLAKNDDSIPPTLTITSPTLADQQKPLNNRTIRIAGNAKDPGGIYSVSINGKEAQLDENGNFFSNVPLAAGTNVLTVSALDINLNESKAELNVSRIADNNNDTRGIEKPVAANNNNIETSVGKYYALIIGVEKYEDKTINKLDQPISDATTLYNILQTNYSFEKENMTILKNPRRTDIYQAFKMLETKVNDNDNVLIFYAGHGFWDDTRKQGYWLPSDAAMSDRSSWISNGDLRENIQGLNSRHTLLITDACFAGGIFKTRAVLDGASKAIKELYENPSRKAMTSGTLKEVPDKSVFIEQLVKHLKNNKEQYLSGQRLFASFSEAVTNNSPNAQIPQYGAIREAGDEGGEFIFIRKQ